MTVMQFTRGGDLKEKMRIGLVEKVRKLLNEQGVSKRFGSNGEKRLRIINLSSRFPLKDNNNNTIDVSSFIQDLLSEQARRFINDMKIRYSCSYAIISGKFCNNALNKE